MNRKLAPVLGGSAQAARRAAQVDAVVVDRAARLGTTVVDVPNDRVIEVLEVTPDLMGATCDRLRRSRLVSGAGGGEAAKVVCTSRASPGALGMA